MTLDHKIEIIGLGSGDLHQLSLGIYKKLIHSNDQIFVRTMDHPVIRDLATEGVSFQSFDEMYEQANSFDEVYKNISATLLQKVKNQSIIYAVPGHPMVAERTVQLLLDQTNVPIEIVGGSSYLDDLFTTLKIDPIEGFQFIDATSFNRYELNYEHHLVFCQVYDQLIASEA